MYFFTFIYIVNCVFSGEIYTAGKKFSLPPALTNFTSEQVVDETMTRKKKVILNI